MDKEKATYSFHCFWRADNRNAEAKDEGSAYVLRPMLHEAGKSVG